MRTEHNVTNNLRSRRLERGLSQQELAERAGVTRQTIGGIEAGLVSASVGVALRLARALGCRVEDLFGLEGEPEVVGAAPAGEAAGIAPGTRVRLARMGGGLIAYPLAGGEAVRVSLYPADGVVVDGGGAGGPVRVRLHDVAGLAERTVVLAGCDPALALLAEQTGWRFPGTRAIWTTAGSGGAMAALRHRQVHAAGVHWPGGGEAEPNVAFVRASLPDRPAVLVNVAYWEQGWLVAAGNPKGIRGAADLVRPDVRIVNRERGAGARRLLDREVTEAGVDAERLRGYRWELPGHLELAQAIAQGRADAGIGIEPTARLFGLDFIPLERERFDLVIPAEYLETAPVRHLLDTLASRSFRTELEAIGGYDTSWTGRIVARTGE